MFSKTELQFTIFNFCLILVNLVNFSQFSKNFYYYFSVKLVCILKCYVFNFYFDLYSILYNNFISIN